MMINTSVYPMGTKPKVEATPTPISTPVPMPVSNQEGPKRLRAKISFTPLTDGWFFNDAQDQKIRFRLIDADFFEKKLKLTEDNVSSYKSMYEDEQKIADRYKKAWSEADEQLTTVLKREGRTKLLYTILGVILTVGAGLTIGYASKMVK